MNLNNNPTGGELRKLISTCDDSAGHHVLWVKKSGEVDLSRISQDQTPLGFQQAHPEMQMRFETFLAGNGYVGPEAAADADWVSELFDRLLQQWRQANGKPEVAYIDQS